MTDGRMIDDYQKQITALRHDECGKCEICDDMRNTAADTIERLTTEVTREERAHGETIDQRDRAEKWADKLAYAIGEHFGVDVGEHSNMNCPWEEALDAIPTVRADQNLTKEETP